MAPCAHVEAVPAVIWVTVTWYKGVPLVAVTAGLLGAEVPVVVMVLLVVVVSMTVTE